MSPAKRLGPTTVRLTTPTSIPALRVSRWARNARRRLGLWRGRIVISTVDLATSRRLNTTYRHRRRATNVLSFTYANRSTPVTVADADAEIILCPDVVRREARASHQTYPDRFRFLLEHGLIHLLGLDHHTTADARRWQRYERRLSRP
ncbi:MAG: rRNA maturation RNase YbeY [Candidatus Kerfeldbacteria bacterium]|nr:rRNA maturation RNase YbeY [Candidatus Kerfeldbacteria bacterium]